jgi:hypothetical protein
MNRESVYFTVKQRSHVLLIVACVLLFAGCGGSKPPLGIVKGHVELDGTPLATGAVITNFASGRGAQGVIKDGRFELGTFSAQDGALVGTHQLAVIAQEKPQGSGPEAKAGKLLVPERYTNPNTSGLSIDVKAGNNSPMLELKSP